MDVAFGSAGEGTTAEDEMTRLLDMGHKLVVVTRGAKGAIASSGSQTWAAPGEKIEALDTTGAGDTFIAYFLANWKISGDVETALREAVRAATETCLYFGGFPQADRGISGNYRSDV